MNFHGSLIHRSSVTAKLWSSSLGWCVWELWFPCLVKPQQLDFPGRGESVLSFLPQNTLQGPNCTSLEIPGKRHLIRAALSTNFRVWSTVLSWHQGVSYFHSSEKNLTDFDILIFMCLAVTSLLIYNIKADYWPAVFIFFSLPLLWQPGMPSAAGILIP